MTVATHEDLRHPEADTSLVCIERSDVIDAAAGLARMAHEHRRAARSRRNAGPGSAGHRAHLRASADVYDAAARRMQSAADEAGR